MNNIINLDSRRQAGAWPPPPEYDEAKATLHQHDPAFDGLPEHHVRAVLRARDEHPGRAQQLRREHRLVTVARRMDEHYRRRWAA